MTWEKVCEDRKYGITKYQQEPDEMSLLFDASRHCILISSGASLVVLSSEVLDFINSQAKELFKESD